VNGHDIPRGQGELATYQCGQVQHYTGHGPGKGDCVSHYVPRAEGGKGCQSARCRVVRVEACPGCARCRQRMTGLFCTAHFTELEHDFRRMLWYCPVQGCEVRWTDEEAYYHLSQPE